MDYNIHIGIIVLLLFMLLFDVLVSVSAHPLLFLNKRFDQIYLNVSYGCYIFVKFNN